MRHHMNVTLPFVTLIIVNIACACVRIKLAEQKNTVFVGRFGRVSYRFQVKRKRKNSDSHNTASYHLFYDIFTPLSHTGIQANESYSMIHEMMQ